MAQTRGFYTGGTIHIVVNNQIGFTTSDPRDTRGTIYCTDIAKMAEAPILHVNGDDPEVCLLAIEIALDYRQQFHQRRLHRSRLLPPARPQRGRRADGDAAADVQEDRAASRARASSTPTSSIAAGVIAAGRARGDDRRPTAPRWTRGCTPTRRSCPTTSRRTRSTGRRSRAGSWTEPYDVARAARRR